MKEWIRQEITACITSFRKTQNPVAAWKPPLIGYAAAQDEQFLRLKDTVSPSHFTPRELLPNAQTVIAYFLPFKENVAQSNRSGPHPSQQWAAAYVETNRLIAAINQHLAQALQAKGYECAVVAPTHNFDKERLLSAWSHKHVAFIAGLGKFGLHQMLITEEGCCGRLGSLATSASIEASPRPAEEFCLYKYNQTCRACVNRCGSGALKENEFDRHKCYAFLIEASKIHREKGSADVCGKCVCIVPCSFVNPVSSS